MDKTNKYLIAIFGLLLDALKEQGYILDNGKFNTQKAKEDKEYYITFWLPLKSLYETIREYTSKIKRKESLKLSKELDSAIKKMTETDFRTGYIMLIVALKLIEYFNDSKCPKHLLLKAQLNKIDGLIALAINVLREKSDRNTIRTSLKIAEAIRDYIEENKLVLVEARLKHKPTWAKLQNKK